MGLGVMLHALGRLDSSSLVALAYSLQGYTYHRMDGGTSVATRARLIDDFNNNPEGEGVWGVRCCTPKHLLLQ